MSIQEFAKYACYLISPLIIIALVGSSLFYIEFFGFAMDAMNDILAERGGIGDRFEIDWNTPLISDIYAKNNNESCDGVDEPAIHMPWFGYKHWCLSY